MNLRDTDDVLPAIHPDRLVDVVAGATFPDLRAADDLGRRAITALGELRLMLHGADRPRRNLTLGLLHLARQSAMPPPEGPSRPDTALARWLEQLYRRGSRVEAILTGLAARSRSLRARNWAWVRNWTLARIALSIAIGIAIAMGHTFIAAGLLGVRMIGSLTTGSHWNYPADGQDDTRRDVRQVAGCLAGHFGDALVLTAVTVGVSLHRGTTLGFVVAGALVAQLFASLARVAVLQVGIHLPQLRLERVIRSGGTLVALCIIGTTQWVTSTLHWSGLAVLVAIPAYLYALIELARTATVVYLNHDKPVSVLLGDVEVYASPAHQPALPRVGSPSGPVW